MPRPPNIDAFTDMRFIANYFLAGCTPPQHLIVEFSQEPTKDLLMLFLMPDLEDIGQAIFEPKGGRRRKPARHGRKKRRGRGIPDPSDMIGQRVRAVVNPYDALQFGPFKYAFRIWNVYEGISFTAAVIDGITNIGFETLWGILKAQPDHCNEFDRLVKTDSDFQTVGGVGPWLQPVNIDIVEFNQGFNQHRTAAQSRNKRCRVNFRVYFRNNRADIRAKGYIALHNTTTGEVFWSSPFDLGPKSGASREVVGTFGEDEWFAWGFANMNGFVDAYDRSIVAFSDPGVPWW